MKLNIFNSLIGLCVATAAVSCSDALVDDVNNRPVGGEKSDMISFVAANNNTTRGGSFGNRPCGGAFLRTSDGADSLYMKAEVADIDDDLLTRADFNSTTPPPKTLKMTCRTRKEGNVLDHYFANELFELNGDVWSSKTPHYWTKSFSNYNFFGYAPAEAVAEANFHANSDTDYIPTIDYSVPAAISDQCDLMYHKAYFINSENEREPIEYIDEYYNKTAPVNLKHALAKVAFKVKSLPAGKEIESFSINNVNNGGTLNLGIGIWNITSSNGSFTLENWLKGEEEEPVIGENCFAVLPGLLSDAVEVSVKLKGESDPYTYYLNKVTTEWEAGKKYIYTISIEEDLPILNITLDDDILDAHYLIAQAYLDASELSDDQTWEVVVSAEGVGEEDTRNQPSLLLTSSLSDFQKEGYWIDNEYSDADCTKLLRGARGGQSLEGSKGHNIPVSIFIPENIDNDRKIFIDLKVDGTTVKSVEYLQKCPGWTNSNYGWEQIQDSEGEFGFDWSKVVYYGYKYDNIRVIPYKNRTQQFRDYCQGIIDDNNAGDYASVSTYTYKDGAVDRTRTQIKIDYNYFSSLPGCHNDENDGMKNTVELFNLSGQSSIGAFEETLKKIEKQASDSSDDRLAFKEGHGDRYGSESTGANSPESPAIAECLKKNRFNLYISTKSDGETVHVISAPVIKESEIVWYMPAVNQFGNIPSNLVNPITDGDKSSYWTSTAIPSSGADKDKFAKLGNGDPGKRLDNHYVRACRKR